MATKNTSNTDETFTVESHFRPLTRSARKDLEQYGIINRTSDKQTPDDPYTAVELEHRPDREVLEEHELRLDETPDETWETDSGEHIAIYPDRVTVDGREIPLSPDEAKQKARNQNRFTRTDN